MGKLDCVTVGTHACQPQDPSLSLVPVVFTGFVHTHCLNLKRERLQVPHSASKCILGTKQQKNN